MYSRLLIYDSTPLGKWNHRDRAAEILGLKPRESALSQTCPSREDMDLVWLQDHFPILTEYIFLESLAPVSSYTSAVQVATVKTGVNE